MMRGNLYDTLEGKEEFLDDWMIFVKRGVQSECLPHIVFCIANDDLI